MSQDGGYPLPAVIDPETRIHVCISVPDEPAHRWAFAGALLELTRWWNWERDPEKKGTEVAKVWQGIVFPVLNQLDLKLEDCVDCNEIADCIISILDGDSEKRLELIDALGRAGIGLSSGAETAGGPNEGVLGQTYGINCDNDVLYGQCFSAVGAINELVVQCLESIEVMTNDAELIGEVADNIPALATLIGTLTDFVTWLQETIAEDYLANYNTTVQEYWACRIYCLIKAQGDCEISFSDIRDAYRAEFASLSIPDANSILPVVITWLATLLGLAPTMTVGAMQLFAIEILARAGYFYGNNFRVVAVALETSEPIEPPESCDCECPVPSVYWDWNSTGNYTTYDISFRHVYAPPTPINATDYAYATGIIDLGELPATITGFNVACAYSWFKTQLHWSGVGTSVNANVALYDGTDTLVAQFDVNCPNGVTVDVNEQFSSPLVGFTGCTIRITFDVDGVNGYGAYWGVSWLSVDELP